jgi:hypothetical protein
MTTKSILIIGDSVLSTMFGASSVLKANILGLSVVDRAVNGSSLTHWYDGTFTVHPRSGIRAVGTTQLPPSGVTDISSWVVGGHEYVLVSLFANDFSHSLTDWDVGVTIDKIKDDALSFVDYLHTTKGYPYAKILFHFKYAFNIAEAGFLLDTRCGPVTENPTLSETGATTINGNFSYFRSIVKPGLESRGVTIIDEWLFSQTPTLWQPTFATPVGPGILTNSEYVLNFSDDGFHPVGIEGFGVYTVTQAHVDIWATNLMGLIRTAIRDH